MNVIRPFFVREFKVKMTDQLRRILRHLHQRNILPNTRPPTISKLPLASSQVELPLQGGNPYTWLASRPRAIDLDRISLASSPRMDLSRFMESAPLIPAAVPGGSVYPAIVIPSAGT